MNSSIRLGIAAAAKSATVALFVTGAVACQGSTGGSTPPPASGTVANTPESPPAGPPAGTQQAGAAAPTSNTVTVAQAGTMGPGSKATVRGLFLGWRGPCQGDPPTRSAWQLADADQKGAACLYVDGPVPPGLDPAGRGAPTWVRVDAELVAAGPNRFLTAQKAEKEAP